MRIEIKRLAERYLPEKLARKAEPLAATADAVLSGTDDNARAQRMAMIIFVIRVASAIIAFVSQVMLARWLGTFEYGIFVAIWVIALFAGNITGVGFPSAVIRLISEYRAQELPGLLRGSIRVSVLVSLVVTTLFSLAAAALLYFYPGVVKAYYIAPAYLALICLPALSLEGVMDGVGRAFNWTYVAFFPTFIMRPLGILVVMWIAILAGFEANAITAMWAGIISTSVTTIYQCVAAFSKLPGEVPKVRSEYRYGYWVAIALPMFLVEGFYILQTSIDIIFVSALMTPEDTAVYYASTKILALVHFVYFAVRGAVSHRYSTFHQQGDRVAFQNFVQRTVAWTFWPSLLLAGLMMVLGKYFLMLFGSEFTSGEYLIWILAIGIVLRSSVGPAESLLVMAGGQNACASIYALNVLVNIMLNFSLIPLFGLAGAAIATTSALAFESLALHALAKRKLGIHVFIIPQRSTPAGNAA